MGTRLLLIGSCFFAAYAFLVFHLYDVQVRRGASYSARASSQLAASGVLAAPRGSIFFTDKNGSRVPAALNKDYPVVYAVPKALEDTAEASAQLASILNLDAATLLKKFATKDSYELVAKKVEDDKASQVQNAHIPGVYVDVASSRFYPLATVAAQVLGFVGLSADTIADTGKYGIEEFYDESLSGTAGSSEPGSLASPLPGDDITLTIDPNIQIEAERILNAVATQYKAEAGTVIVQDPATGKILAMGSTPSFDPNEYGKSSLSALSNPAVQQLYEPGSVFKVLTMAAGIDSGAITPNTTFMDTGVLKLNGRTIRNWDKQAHGLVTMTNVIEQSLNTGAAFAQRKTGDEPFKKYVTKFGFGQKLGVDLPGEVKGDLRQLFAKDAPSVAFATASFGQGVAVTPLQMINSFSALANGGMLMRPYVNIRMGEKELGRVISPSTASQVATMMVSAVDKAKVAHINGYSLAGKTGTAFIPDFVHGGYSDDVINTYIGFGPTKNPRFTILFKLVRPAGAPLAGQTVVPAFRELAQFLINYYNIPPDRISQ